MTCDPTAGGLLDMTAFELVGTAAHIDVIFYRRIAAYVHPRLDDHVVADRGIGLNHHQPAHYRAACHGDLLADGGQVAHQDLVANPGAPVEDDVRPDHAGEPDLKRMQFLTGLAGAADSRSWHPARYAAVLDVDIAANPRLLMDDGTVPDVRVGSDFNPLQDDHILTREHALGYPGTVCDMSARGHTLFGLLLIPAPLCRPTPRPVSGLLGGRVTSPSQG